MANFSNVLCISIVLSTSFAYADFARSNFILEKHGSEVCRSPSNTDPCYKTLGSVGIPYSNDVEELYRGIKLFNSWEAISPDKLPDSETYLRWMGGAIVLDRAWAEAVTNQFSLLNVTNLSVNLDSTKETQQIPFALSVIWKMRDGRGGTLHTTGFVQIVPEIFHLDLDHIPEFRDRFVDNTRFAYISGDLFDDPSRSSTAQTELILKKVIAPCLIGKYVSVGRIGFNQIERDLKDKMQGVLEKVLPKLKGKDL